MARENAFIKKFTLLHHVIISPNIDFNYSESKTDENERQTKLTKPYSKKPSLLFNFNTAQLMYVSYQRKQSIQKRKITVGHFLI
jgi:hypothetical protein